MAEQDAERPTACGDRQTSSVCSSDRRSTDLGRRSAPGGDAMQTLDGAGSAHMAGNVRTAKSI
jgi:hypothetical protein